MKTSFIILAVVLSLSRLCAADAPVPVSPAALANASGLPIAAFVNGVIVTRDGSTLPADVIAWVNDCIAAENVLPFADVLTARIPHWPNAEFLRRFTAEERQAFYTAARVSAALEDLKTLLLATPIIRATDSDLVAGMAALVSAGIITDARRVQILGAGVSP